MPGTSVFSHWTTVHQTGTLVPEREAADKVSPSTGPAGSPEFPDNGARTGN